MMVKKKSWIVSLMLATALLLTACGGTAESKITGIWKLDSDDEEPTFLEIGEEQIIIRRPSNNEPMIASYIFTETQSDNFILEVINPEDGSKVFLLEGYMDGKDRIAVVDAPGDPADLIRVDDMEKEIEEHETKAKAAEDEQARINTAQRKEDEKQQRAVQKKQEEQAKADEKARAEEEKRQAEEQKDEEREREELAEVEKEKAEEKQIEIETAASTSNPSDGSVKDEYYQKAKKLHDEMNSDANEIYSKGGSPGDAFAGQYYTDWDNLLNEVWGLLEKSMPNDEYEILLAEQLEWIEMKEKTFATEYSDITAAERGKGYAYLSNVTQERARYLIDNYL